MAEAILMPRMSDTMEEGVIATWHKKVGDTVKEGDIIADVETDKATMELECYEEGTLLYLAVEAGGSVPVDALVAIVGEANEDYQALLGEYSNTTNTNGTENTNAEASTNETSISSELLDVKVENAVAVLMPRMSDTMEEGVIATWHKNIGEQVKEGDILAEVETDKATMELEAYDEGILLYRAVEDGGSVAVDGLLAVIGEEGANFEALIAQHNATQNNTNNVETQPKEEAQNTSQTSTSSNGQSQNAHTDGRIKASPLAKRLANDKGFHLADIPGSGPNGRIVKKDVENFVPQTKTAETTAPTHTITPAVFGQESFEEVPVSQMRKTIARRLGESKFTAPHFYLTMEILMDNMMASRKKINEVSPVKISFNDIVIKAAAMSLRQHPTVNASWQDNTIRMNHHIHVGMAVAVDQGLLVPVIRFTDGKSLSQIASETKELAGKAKNKELQPSDWEGNTFSVSNLGMFGIEEFTAIINPPDACILAVGGIKQTGVVKNGELVIGNVMKVTLSCDHRVVDGASGAAFLQTLKGYLENPVTMLV